jgi:hypothetical protein
MGLNKRLISTAAAGGGVVNTENFNTVLYTGNQTTNQISVGFQPDLVWMKGRSLGDGHCLYDSVRGVIKELGTQRDGVELTLNTGLTSFDSNGFTLGSRTEINRVNSTYVAWCFKGGGAAVSNTDGSITSSVSANQDAGFSIVKYSGNSTMGATIGHGLSATIDLLIVKNLTEGNQNWRVQASALGGTKGASLNTSDDFVNATYWNNTAATSTVFTVDNSAKVNATGDDYIAYCFHSVDGYQKVGTYTGTGSSGLEITTGFQPRFLMIKRTDSTGDWDLFITTLSEPPYLKANKSDSQATGDRIDVGTTSFTLKDNGSSRNASNGTYIYLAIA